MRKTVACLIAFSLLFTLAAALAAPEKGEWTGWVTDESCGKKGFNNPNHANCAKKCISGGKKAALAIAEDKIVLLDVDKAKAEEFAGAHVKVTGTLNESTNTVKVEKIEKVEKK